MEVIVKLDEAQLSEITDVCNAAIAQCEKYKRDSETLRALRNLIGYIECGEGSAVIILKMMGLGRGTFASMARVITVIRFVV